MGRTRYQFGEDGYPHFMTSSVVAWLPAFAYPQYAEMVLGSWRFLQTERDIKILAWVILENHIHWIAVGPELARRAGEFKSYTARRIIDRMERCEARTMLQELHYFKLRHKIDQEHQLWQEGSHPQIIETVDMMWQKLEYIHNNPLRRGYVDDPVHWRYSSARSYAGRPGLLEITTDWM
jgi:putative transposase